MQVLRVGRVTGLVGQDVLDGDTPIDSRQHGVVVVERGVALVVFAGRRGERRKRSVLAFLPLGDDTLERANSTVTSRLDVVAVESRLLAHLVVGHLMQDGRTGFSPLAVPRGVHDVIGRPQELVNRLVKQVRLIVRHVEFDRDSSTDLHITHNPTYA